MTKTTFLKHYRNHSAAEGYIFGIERNEMLYIAIEEELMPRYCAVSYESKTHEEKLVCRLKAKDKDRMIKTAICLGNAEELFASTGIKNKGVALEKLVFEYFGQEFRGKDNIGFWVQGDINIDGVEYQIKFQTSSVVNITTLQKLNKGLK